MPTMSGRRTISTTRSPCCSTIRKSAVVCGQAVDWHSWDDPGGRNRRALPWPPGVVVPPPRMLTALLRRGAFRTPTCNLLVRNTCSMRSVDVRPVPRPVRGPGLAGEAVSHAAVRDQRHPHCAVPQARGSSTATAVRRGHLPPGPAQRQLRAFLRWLRGLPEVQDGEEHEELRSPVRSALAAVRPGPTAPHGGRSPRCAPRVPPHARRLLRGAARRAAPRAGADGLPPPPDAAEPAVRIRPRPARRPLLHRAVPARERTCHRRPGARGRRQRVHTPVRRSRVTQADVLNVDAGDSGTTIVADLAEGDNIPSAALRLPRDHPDASPAVRPLCGGPDPDRILRPGGTCSPPFPASVRSAPTGGPRPGTGH